MDFMSSFTHFSLILMNLLSSGSLRKEKERNPRHRKVVGFPTLLREVLDKEEIKIDNRLLDRNLITPSKNQQILGGVECLLSFF